MTATPPTDRTFPLALAELSRVEPDGWGEISIEPYEDFVSEEAATSWLTRWTGNESVSGDAYRIFAQDAYGGYVALWLERDGQPLADQPVVFLSSEGETGVVAENLSDFLWILANGSGPFEIVCDDNWSGEPNQAFEAIAERHATTPRRSTADILASAKHEFPDFELMVEGLCR